MKSWPFAGSGAVFYNKRPGAVETINDLDGDIVNLFRVLRDNPKELKRLLTLTPYSREEYDRSFEPCEDPLERARRYMVRTTQAIGAKMSNKCGWRNHKQMKIGGAACKWAGITDTIDAAAKRLRGDTTHLVQIESMDALRLIERYNNSDVLMYLDPPYVLDSRRSGKLYRHEMSDDDHRRLLELICRSKPGLYCRDIGANCTIRRYANGTRTLSNHKPPPRRKQRKRYGRILNLRWSN